MHVTHYKDYTGTWFREITDVKHSSLKAIKEEYEKRGRVVWLNYFGRDQWILTVKEGDRRLS